MRALSVLQQETIISGWGSQANFPLTTFHRGHKIWKPCLILYPTETKAGGPGSVRDLAGFPWKNRCYGTRGEGVGGIMDWTQATESP